MLFTRHTDLEVVRGLVAAHDHDEGRVRAGGAVVQLAQLEVPLRDEHRGLARHVPHLQHLVLHTTLE